MSDKDKKTTYYFKTKFISLEIEIQILDRFLKGEKAYITSKKVLI